MEYLEKTAGRNSLRLHAGRKDTYGSSSVRWSQHKEQSISSLAIAASLSVGIDSRFSRSLAMNIVEVGSIVSILRSTILRRSNANR